MELITRPTIQLSESFQVSRTGLEISGEPTWEACAELGKRLPILEQALQFAFGDFAIYIESRFGEQAAQIIDDSDGWSESTIRVYRWVCEKVTPTNRRADLSFWHHQLVAAMEPKLQRSWLEKAAAATWSVGQFRHQILGSSEAGTISVWLVVQCKDREDLEALKTELESKGRTCKDVEKHERVAGKKEKAITAKAKNPKKKTARSRG